MKKKKETSILDSQNTDKTDKTKIKIAIKEIKPLDPK